MPTLPSYMKISVNGFSLSGPKGAVLRTNMDAGPVKTRPRFTAAPRDMAVTFIPITSAQLATFEAFHDDDLAMGSLAFDMTHPATQATVSARFTSEYSVAWSGPDSWVVSAQLELLP